MPVGQSVAHLFLPLLPPIRPATWPVLCHGLASRTGRCAVLCRAATVVSYGRSHAGCTPLRAGPLRHRRGTQHCGSSRGPVVSDPVSGLLWGQAAVAAWTRCRISSTAGGGHWASATKVGPGNARGARGCGGAAKLCVRVRGEVVRNCPRNFDALTLDARDPLLLHLTVNITSVYSSYTASFALHRPCSALPFPWAT